MHARRARLATATQLLCSSVSSRYNDSSYVGSKVLIADRQQELLKAFLTADGSKINAKQNLVPSSDGSQMVTETNNLAWKPGQRRCPKSLLTALTCDYLTALVILAAAPAVKYCRLTPCLPRLHSLALPESPSHVSSTWNRVVTDRITIARTRLTLRVVARKNYPDDQIFLLIIK